MKTRKKRSPANRRSAGGDGHPIVELGKDTRFQPGQGGNANGKPKWKLLSDAPLGLTSSFDMLALVGGRTSAGSCCSSASRAGCRYCCWRCFFGCRIGGVCHRGHAPPPRRARPGLAGNLECNLRSTPPALFIGSVRSSTALGRGESSLH